jgi:hypothetical protein
MSEMISVSPERYRQAGKGYCFIKYPNPDLSFVVSATLEDFWRLVQEKANGVEIIWCRGELIGREEDEGLELDKSGEFLPSSGSVLVTSSKD